jgi:hypothetical protein
VAADARRHPGVSVVRTDQPRRESFDRQCRVLESCGARLPCDVQLRQCIAFSCCSLLPGHFVRFLLRDRLVADDSVMACS